MSLAEIEAGRRRARRALHAHQTPGERIAAAIAAFLGSFRYLILQTLAMVLWVSLNISGWIHHWDPYPFLLMNILLSTQAAYAAPLLQLSANRTQRQDRERDVLEADEVDLELTIIREMHGMQQELLDLQRTQMDILDLLHRRQD